MHKYPSKTKSKIAPPKYSAKTFSKAVTSVSKLMYKQIENHDSKMLYFSVIKPF